MAPGVQSTKTMGALKVSVLRIVIMALATYLVVVMGSLREGCPRGRGT